MQKKVIAVGSCGALKNLAENAYIVPNRALRAEGTSYHYLPVSRYIELDEAPIPIRVFLTKVTVARLTRRIA